MPSSLEDNIAIVVQQMRDGTLQNEDYKFWADQIGNKDQPVWMRQELAKANADRYGMPYQDPAANVTQPDISGMGSDMGQRTPMNTVDSPAPWQGSGSHDPQGNVIAGGTADDSRNNYGRAARGPSDWSGFSQGTQSVDPGYQTDWGDVGAPAQQEYWQGGGVNQPFYSRQFNKLVGERNEFQNQQDQAQTIRQRAQDTPAQNTPADWSWVEGGLPEVQTTQGTADAPYTWDRLSGITSGQTTNKEISDLLRSRNLVNERQGDQFDAHFATEGVNPNSVNWSTFANPTEAIAGIDPGAQDGWRNTLMDAYNGMFTRSDLTTPAGGGPTAVPGYALPISGGI